MTRNRALKRAARERAAATGESYVVARRSVLRGNAVPASAPTGAVTGALHRWTHLVPGVPAHPATVTNAGRHPTRVRRVHAPHPVREKRVLRGWQQWIERRVAR